MGESVVYPGRDLEAMSFAVNYHRWILDEFRPFLGKRIVEVGAGTGSFSEMLLAEGPESLTLVEPSEMFGQLTENLPDQQGRTAVNFYHNIFGAVAETVATQDRPDSIFYVNVLEHIEEDEAELRLIRETLDVGGRCFIFVPALESLYGEFDRKIGHFRRYDRAGLEAKCAAAGLTVVRSKYFDLVGIVPWWVKYKLLRSDSLGSGAVTLYDKVAVPMTRLLEKLLAPPVGKNILLIAEKCDV